tara:strand:+ start:16916 stop:18493 length:1578 start_codon:yes stop_codon:yes gene_type:complete
MLIDISDDVYNDTLIDNWMVSKVILEGTKNKMKDILRKPINDINTLVLRQNAVYMKDISCIMYYLKECESDLKWALDLQNDDEERNNMLNMLYPNEFYNSFMSYINEILEVYHGYKIYIVPLIQLSSPLGIIMAPYMYLKKTLGIDMSINDYIQIIYKILKFTVNSENYKEFLIKLVTMCFYIAVYVYGIWQTFDLSFTLHNFRETLLKNINAVAKFVEISSRLLDIVTEKNYIGYCDVIYDKTFKVDGNLSDVYCFWTNSFNYIDRLNRLIETVYSIDISNTISKLYRDKDWCISIYNDKTEMYGMKNPLLKKQVSNPFVCSKSLVVTGPNAAGKTTYIKAILSNYILSQTIGICMCKKAYIKPLDVIATFMRIHDIVGQRSYYEAETEYCKMMLDKAEKNKMKNCLFVMDEPMHSTPPTEGAATCYAVCEYLGRKYKNTKLLITTHYHSMVNLEKDNKDIFMNVSMDAIDLGENQYKFPYKLRNKYSFQCIAIELLGREKFPKELIENAIKIKNKISKSKIND